MSDYTTVGGDSLPAIAELFGHPGEWLEIATLNGDVWGDYNNLQPGLELTLPAEWVHEPEIEPPADSTDYSSMTASQLANLARSATTLAELDAIDAAAAGRVTVMDAVSTRRNELLDQGATA